MSHFDSKKKSLKLLPCVKIAAKHELFPYTLNEVISNIVWITEMFHKKLADLIVLFLNAFKFAKILNFVSFLPLSIQFRRLKSMNCRVNMILISANKIVIKI